MSRSHEASIYKVIIIPVAKIKGCHIFDDTDKKDGNNYPSVWKVLFPCPWLADCSSDIAMINEAYVYANIELCFENPIYIYKHICDYKVAVILPLLRNNMCNYWRMKHGLELWCVWINHAGRRSKLLISSLKTPNHVLFDINNADSIIISILTWPILTSMMTANGFSIYDHSRPPPPYKWLGLILVLET